MEKKQNELVAKLSDAKLAAVKQQASVAHSGGVVVLYPGKEHTCCLSARSHIYCVNALELPAEKRVCCPARFTRRPSVC